ncbi:(S)-benzoin forming benzil reductase [Lederbergia sp. NSJ-179]|uniref:(S)-benzoin forming benzil reductase n=1 Tax=Lederbergia sp. NSJ-179 TaxID=2931402 RepID=UPI001FD16569|nr:(S)-benzoin forming benzil reductase [Lederbergia sp. NSJ-179]MCJ7841729.1 (S)-benzoin forming benzil reductase [Lederbergia sp. NSJ-179]
MDVYVITGASKGIGFALSKQLLQKNHRLICVARTKNTGLLQIAKERHCPLLYIEQDLAQTEKLPQLMEQIFAAVPEEFQSITLINNAGLIEPIGKVENLSPEAIATNIAVNLTAPMVLTSLFIKRLEKFAVTKKIINLSSGAGRTPYSGWSSYCAGKAGLDHFTRVVSVEQANEKYGVKVISIAPGIIDTGMQEKIRSSKRDEFALVDQFIDYKEKNLLQSADQTAERLIKVIQHRSFFKLEPVLDIRNL